MENCKWEEVIEMDQSACIVNSPFTIYDSPFTFSNKEKQ